MEERIRLDKRKGLDIRTWLFDLDGTLYFENQAAPGAQAVLDFIRATGRNVLFVTNNSRHSSIEIMQKLHGMGLDAPVESIITATEYTGRYLRERYGRLAVSVAGSAAFEEAHREAGHEVLPLNGNGRIDAVVIGLDETFSYNKLEQIVQAVGTGARLIAANSDLYHPGHGGRKVPETGALVSAVEAASGISADYVGKPFPYLFEYALQLCDTKPSQAIMVGDNYHTDIVGGKGAGLHTVWLNGYAEERGSDSESRDHPAADWNVPHMPELFRLIGGDQDEN